MQFFTDPNQTGNMATNFKGAMKATLHRCVIRLDEVETFLAADVERNYDITFCAKLERVTSVISRFIIPIHLV